MEFERVVFEAGLPPCRLHHARHCAATTARAAGADAKAIAAMLRNGVDLAQRTYTNVLPDEAPTTAASVARLIDGGPEPAVSPGSPTPLRRARRVTSSRRRPR